MTVAPHIEPPASQVFLFRERPEGAFRHYDMETLAWSLPGDILRLDFSMLTPFQVDNVIAATEEEGFSLKLHEDTSVMVLDVVLTLPEYAFDVLGYTALRFN